LNAQVLSVEHNYSLENVKLLVLLRRLVYINPPSLSILCSRVIISSLLRCFGVVFKRDQLELPILNMLAKRYMRPRGGGDCGGPGGGGGGGGGGGCCLVMSHNFGTIFCLLKWNPVFFFTRMFAAWVIKLGLCGRFS